MAKKNQDPEKEDSKSPPNSSFLTGAALSAQISKKLFLLRRERRWTQQQASKAIEVNLRTYQNWETEKGLSRPATIQKIADGFGVDISYFYQDGEDLESEALITLPVTQIIKREGLCSDVWIVKSGKFFLSGENEETRDKMIRLMIDKQVRFHFVYTKPSEGSSDLPSTAEKSFGVFCNFAKRHAEKNALANQIEGHPITERTIADKLGLFRPWMAFVMAEYTSEGIEKFKKDFDVWLEFEREVIKGNPASGRRWYWIELSLVEANSWRDVLMNVRNQLTKVTIDKFDDNMHAPNTKKRE